MTEPVSIDVTTDEMTVVLTRLVAMLGNPAPVYQDIGELMVARTKDNFRTSTAPDGTPWAPRSQTTLDAYDNAKPKKTPKGGPLWLTGTMAGGIAYEADAEGVSWGSNAIQAAVMQFGAAQGAFGASIGKDKNGRDYFTTIPWGDIPARPFVGVGPDDETALTELLEDWLEDAARL